MNFITSVFDKLCILTIVEQLSRGSDISLDEQNVEDTDPCCLLCRHLPGSQMLQVQCKDGYNLNLDIRSYLHYITVLLNSDHQKKKLLHPKSIPTSQCYNCTLIFNNFEMFRMKIFELKPQTGGVNA